MLAADTVVDEEEAGGVVRLFHRGQTGVIRAPEGLLPLALEEIALRDVRSRLGSRRRQLVHRPADSARVPARRPSRRVEGPGTPEAGWTAGDDRQRERVEHRGIGGGVPRRRQLRLPRRPARPLLKCSDDPPVAAGGEQRIGQRALLIACQAAMRGATRTGSREGSVPLRRGPRPDEVAFRCAPAGRRRR